MSSENTAMKGALRWAFKFSTWTPTRDQWMLAASLVQPEEKTRIGKFVFKKDAKSAMAGRLLIRKAVSESLGIPYNQVKLARTEKGKPYLVNENKSLPGFNFNVSHQGEFAVLAAEPVHAVGVDVMQVERPRGSRTVEEFFETMNRQFTEQEWEAIRDPIDESLQLKQFYRYWCLKESYVKALGIGIGFSISRLDFIASSDTMAGSMISDTRVCVDEKLEENWQFTETMLDDSHCVAVGLKQENEEPWPPQQSFTVLNFKDLVDGVKSSEKGDEDYWKLFTAKKERPR